MEYSSPLLFLYVLHLYLTSSGFALARFSYSMNLCVHMCVCVCVFNSMCVLERVTNRPTPTERWCVVYDFSRESRCTLSFPRVWSGQLPHPLLTSLAHPKPHHRPRALPARNGQCRSKESVPHSCSGRGARPLAGACVEGRSGFKSDGCFIRPT